MTPEIERLHKRLRLGRALSSPEMVVTRCVVQDQPVVFCTDMEDDPIQRNHRRGGFYEIGELNLLKEIFPDGGTMIDIGANVGNHLLFAALILKAKRIVPIEPNPQVYRMLIENVLANGLQDTVDLTRLGVGLSDAHSGGFAMQDKKRNRGSARMLPGKGELEVHRGDVLLAGETPDLIKIDVEGMEMSVLSGLDLLLREARPDILLEVDNENDGAFQDWVANSGYVIAHTHQRYRLNRNHILIDAQNTAKIDRVAAYAAAREAKRAEAAE